MRCIQVVTGVCVVLGVMGCGGDDASPSQPAADSSTTDTSVADTQKPDVGVVPDASTGDTAAADTAQIPDALADSSTHDAADASVADSAVADGTVADTNVAETTVPDDAIADATVVDEGTDALTVVNCGSSPYQAFDPLVALIVVDTPKTAVTITGNICPETTLDIPYMQMRAMNVQRNAPFFFIATQTGSLINLSREFNVTVSAFAKLPYQATMYPPTFPVGIDPAWDSNTKALLSVVVNSTSGSGACNAKDGVSYSVVNHPEAVIAYKNGGTSTSAGGDAYAWISLVTTGTVAAPEYVTITQTKAACKVDLNGADKLFVTGRAPIAVNAVTVGLSGEVMNP
jgi:hypothetical protein